MPKIGQSIKTIGKVTIISFYTSVINFDAITSGQFTCCKLRTVK